MKEPKAKAEQTLVKKLVEILGDLGPIEKKSRNPHFGYNYVSEGQVMAELRHRLSSRGIFLFTSVETCVPHYSDEPKAGVFVEVTTIHTFYDADSKEKFVVKSAGVGWDSGDKGVYKAITGAMKYALMKNFLLTDEQDPEAADDGPSAATPGKTGHKRTKPYEEETGEGDTKVATDLLELKAFLTEHKIPDGFLLTMLREKELIDGHTKNVAQLKPGVLLRCLGPKSKANLVKAWKEHKTEGEVDAPSSAFTADEPPDSKAQKTSKVARPDDEIRTPEGDQRRERQPVQDDVSPADLLEQDGFDNWREVKIHFGKQNGEKLGGIGGKSLDWWVSSWTPKQWKGRWNAKDLILDAALVLAQQELGGGE